MRIKTQLSGDLPGSPVVKTSPSNAGGAGSIPGQGAKKFNKDFKNGPR